GNHQIEGGHSTVRECLRNLRGGLVGREYHFGAGPLPQETRDLVRVGRDRNPEITGVRNRCVVIGVRDSLIRTDGK
ncbi:MAG: hypothetical protein P4L86_15415, partial [Mycobacterium sp.]|nr:hypothetical protein [Mycobacterium sp.]